MNLDKRIRNLVDDYPDYFDAVKDYFLTYEEEIQHIEEYKIEVNRDKKFLQRHPNNFKSLWRLGTDLGNNVFLYRVVVVDKYDLLIK